MTKYVINGGKTLNGEVTISGAKNAAVAIVPAALLADGPVRIENVPKIIDVTLQLEIMRELGAQIRLVNATTVEIQNSQNPSLKPHELERKLRASYYLLGVLLGKYGFAEVAENGDEMWSVFAQNFTAISAYSFLVFNLLCAPCFAAIGAMNAEMKSAKWLWAGIGLQLGTGYTVGFLVYQIGTLVTTGAVGAGFFPGLIAVVAFAAVLVYLCMKTEKDLKREYALSGAKS